MSKRERIFANLLKVTQQLIQGKSYKPLTSAELMKKLSLPEVHTELFQEIIEKLVGDNIIELAHGRYRGKVNQKPHLQGTLSVHPRGFGFFQSKQSEFSEDIFIPKPMMLNAIDGDTVEVEVNTDVISDKGPEGKVVAILSRQRTHAVGIVHTIEKNGAIYVHVPLLGTERQAILEYSKKTPVKVGDRIVMKIVEWGDKDHDTVCQLERYIGHISDPSCDVQAAIEEFELRDHFLPQAIEEAEQFGNRVTKADMEGREDLREIECFTIDPDTAKDFDDALNLSKDKKGHYHLGVHIADVSHYVRPGSFLDKEAGLRCNSTYFPGFCLPMLPGALSENLCSLKANVNRLTVSVLAEFDPKGNMLNYRIVRSVIKSAQRFTYKEAKAVLDGKKKSQYLPTLQLMVELCALLKKKRYERGSIEFALPELVVLVDKKGDAVGTDCIEYDVTHQLVEEFMLKANEVVATHLSNMGKNLTYRIHDEPSEENLRDFSMLAGAFGFKLSKKPTPAEIQLMFDEALSTPYGAHLATSYIRRMRLAVYSPDNIGHYGLSLTHYCHFTSPIRRYVDLVAHRLLFGESDDRIELEKISAKASERERISSKAENQVVLLKKLRFLDSLYKKDPQKQYEAIITKIKGFGLYFEVIDLMLEGFVHISELGSDYYVYEEEAMRLRGRHSGQTFFAGDKVIVMLKNVNLIMLESNWHMVAEDTKRVRSTKTTTKRTSKSKPKAHSKMPKFKGPKAKRKR